jgi:SAM-dependent methyltransferase
MTQKLFGDLTDVYEALVDWPRRLAREGPFYRRWFERCQVRRVLDSACGTGHHAAMFHGWGLTVEGADLSAAMIERARGRYGEPPGLQWAVRSFDQPCAAEELFDAVICAGNSLALAPDRPTVQRALQQMHAAVRPGGLIVVHLLNLWRLPDGPCVWQKCQRVRLPPREVLVIKGVHRSGGQGFVDLIVADPSAVSEMDSESVPLLGLEAGELEQMAGAAGAAGAAKREVFGDYAGASYVRESSADLILVAQK